MTHLNRRTLLEATGASLLGLTVTGTPAGATTANDDVTLLEARLAFDVGDVQNLEKHHSDRPSKYSIDPDRNELRIRTVSEREAAALREKNRLVAFNGIRADVDSIGGITVQSLPLIRDGAETCSTAVYSETGYDMPEIEVDWDTETYPQILSSSNVRDVRIHEGFLRARLPSQSVDLRKKVVRDVLVEDDSLPTWKRSAVVDRPTTTVVVRPSLTVAVHRTLDIVDAA